MPGNTDTSWTAARLVPELSCSDFDVSLHFFRDILGFSILYDRPEDQFAYLERGGAQIMLEQESPHWTTGPREPPYGRGVNFQIEIEDTEALARALRSAGYSLFRDIETKWYRMGDRETGNRQFLVQDPDGYLLRFFEDLGTRPARHLTE